MRSKTTAGSKKRHGPGFHASDRQLWMVPLFKDYVGWSGIHGAGGKSLMHFAREPEVARWLVEHGAPCDVADEEGKFPGDVLPPDVAAIVNAHLFGKSCALATQTAARSRGRL
jgi:hypothetical protein